MFLSISYLEWAATVLTALCIFLAGRNKISTWPVGIVATILFAVLFFQAKLYADVTLQVFFMVTGIIGWSNWKNKTQTKNITSIDLRSQLKYSGLAILTALIYGSVLHYFTDAYAPFIDSLVLTFSILAQFLLMRKHIQTWMFWLLVNSLSVPLFISRDLRLAAFMYGVFWVNALVSYFYWNKLMQAQK